MKKYILFLTTIIFSIHGFSQPGSPDLSFGNSGIVIGQGFGECNAMDIQSTGKIILAGSLSNHGEYNSIARYHTDGSLDSTFGDNGRVVFYDARFHGIQCMAVLPSDKIITAVVTGRPSIAQYTPDGKLDSSFGVNGIVVSDFGSYFGRIHVGDIAVQPDGKILVAGRDSNYLAVVVRYLPDGPGWKLWR